VASSRRPAPEYPLGRLPRIPLIPANRRPGAQDRTLYRRTPRPSRQAGRQSDGSLRWATHIPRPARLRPTSRPYRPPKASAMRNSRRGAGVGRSTSPRSAFVISTVVPPSANAPSAEVCPFGVIAAPLTVETARRAAPGFAAAGSLVPRGFRASCTRRRPERRAREGAIAGSRSGAWRISGRGRHPATNRFGGFPANRSPCAFVARCAKGLSAVRQRVIDGDMGGRSCAIRPTGGVVRRRTRERTAVARRSLLSGRARRLSPRRVTVLGFG